MTDETAIYLQALEHVAGRLAAAERIEEFLEEAAKLAIAAVQLARTERATPPGLVDVLGGSWDVPFAAVDERLTALSRRMEAIETPELQVAASAAAKLAGELDRLSVDLKGVLREERLSRA